MKRLILVLLFSLMTTQLMAAEPVFSIAWSEYPSWSVFGVAGTTKIKGELLVDGREGSMGSIEKKWGVDIVLKEADYDSCIVMYGAGKCDAACVTNMDTLNPALSRQSVAIMPTSTSYGADACIVPNTITKVEQLKGKSVYGLAKSVSEYAFCRNLTLLGQKETDYKFVNMDPSAAATAMQQSNEKIDAIMVWNPFVMETLNKCKNSHRLFDSTTIPGEIIDMVVMSQASLDREGGDKAACAIADTYYTVCRLLADKANQDDMLVALGEKFSHLNAKSMAECCRQTRFFSTPEQGIALFTGTSAVFPWKKEVADTSELFNGKAVVGKEEQKVTTKRLEDVMPLVVDFCFDKGIIPNKPTIGYGGKEQAPKAQLRFDATYIKKVLDSK